MFFRFGSALILVVMTSLLGILVEKQNLTLRREISRQHYRMDVLQEEHARLRLRSQQLAAVERLFETIEDEDSGLVAVEPGSAESVKFQPETTFQPETSSTPTDQDDQEASADDRPLSGKRDFDLQDSPEQQSVDGKAQPGPRRVPLLFWRKPASDPRLRRGSP